MTLEETFADWGPSYDAMVAELEHEALDEAERDQELQAEPEFLPIAHVPEIGVGDVGL
jgi:hypothetical protein